ncbi:MAG: hypothetical protein Tsb0017_24140 [Geothermobacteraceae bacterium]
MAQTRSTKKTSKAPPTGVAGLYSKTELRRFFSGFLLVLGVAEGLIFFFGWISFLAGGQVAFPWKACLIAAFLVPVALCFLLGLTVYGFNRYLIQDADGERAARPDGRPANRFEEAMLSLRQVPFLVALLLLVLGGGLVYKLDAIVAFVVQAGGEAARYLFILLLVVLGVAALVTLVWMLLSYRLRCRRLDRLHQFRMEVIERTGMVLMEDETLIDRDGQVVRQPPEGRNAIDIGGEDLTLLPALPRRKKEKK